MKNILLIAKLFILFSISFITVSNAEKHPQAISLEVITKKITINNKHSIVYRIKQPDGQLGLVANKGDQIKINVTNKITNPTSIHWHGLILPNSQDGVPYVTQLPIKPGDSYHYQYPIIQAGTYWMHSHFRLQEQRLLAAPYIIKNPNEKISDQEVVIMLEDFSFKSPIEIYKKLRCQQFKHKMTMQKMDINDVDYDAFLANEKTLEHPDIITIKPNTKIRLRIINAAVSTNFYISLGKLSGKIIAVDGNDVKPLPTKMFPLAMAQRVDILLNIPDGNSAYPILAQVEGSNRQTGIILTTTKTKIPTLTGNNSVTSKPFDYQQELALKAQQPLAKLKVTRSIPVELEGDMQKYIWKINNKTWPYFKPLVVKKGDRVELVFHNKTSMSHPMHLHGHVFQVTNINGKEINGANRDTILVLPNSTVSVQFNANNPGVWMLHCHNLYHAAAGMMTELVYADYTPLKFTKQQQASMSGELLFQTQKECDNKN